MHKPEKVRIADKEGRWSVEFDPEQFRQLADIDAIRAVHPDATVAWAGPDGCRGALVMTKREKEMVLYRELEPAAKAALAALPVAELKVLWFEPKRYNDRPGYRWSARGVSTADGKTTLRYRYSIGERYAYVFEVLAWSPSHFSVARWCHDAVTAAVTF